MSQALHRGRRFYYHIAGDFRGELTFVVYTAVTIISTHGKYAVGGVVTHALYVASQLAVYLSVWFF